MHLFNLTGPTSSGKSEMGVQLAKYLGTENSIIVSTDSRQIYKGLNIGTGKIQGTWLNNTFLYKDIRHYLIDYIEPVRQYTLAEYLLDYLNLFDYKNDQWQFKSDLKVTNIILVGGTGLYSKAILEEMQPGILKSEYTEDFQNLKTKLNGLKLFELQDNIKNLKLELNESDYANSRRLISKIAHYWGNKNGWFKDLLYPEYESKKSFFIDLDTNDLKKKITKRFEDRFQIGLLEEVEDLMYLGEERLLELGLEYRLVILYKRGLLKEEELKNKIIQENLSYAKRQVTWFKKQNYQTIHSLEDIIQNT